MIVCKIVHNLNSLQIYNFAALKYYSMLSVAVFCASSKGNDPIYMRSAYDLGKSMALKNMILVNGGTKLGLMDAVAEGVLENGGIAMGIIVRDIYERGLGNRGFNKMEIVETLSMRKMRMKEVSDAFIVLPGGYGTMDELFEMAALNQTGRQNKPIALFNIKGFYDPLLRQISTMKSEGLMRNPERNGFIVCDEAEDLLDKIATAVA